METPKEIIPVNDRLPTSIALSPAEKKTARLVWRLDMVKSFPFEKVELESWARHIHRLCPDVTEERISQIIDKYLTGEWKFNKDEGISQIIWHINNPNGAVWNP